MPGRDRNAYAGTPIPAREEADGICLLHIKGSVGKRRNAKTKYAKVSDTAGRLSDGITRVPAKRAERIAGYEKHVIDVPDV